MRILEDTLRDAVYGIRQLRRSPAFTVTAVLTLALAIGANVSIFAVVERVVLNPLPYPDSNRLIQLDHGFPSVNVPSGVGLTVGLGVCGNAGLLAEPDLKIIENKRFHVF